MQSATGGTLSGNTLLGTLNGAASRSLTPAHKTTISFDANYYANAWGSHDLQAGTYLQPNLETWSDTYYANQGFTTQDSVLINENNPALGYRPFHRRYVEGDVNGVRTSHIGADDYAVYIQDRWSPTNRLSISPGLRVEWIAAQDKLFDVETQASWNVAPRIGATYVLTNDQKHVVRASWGRVTDIPNASYFDSAGNTRVATRDEYDVNGDGVFELVQSTPASTTLSASQTRDPDRHQGYVQEWIVGYRTQLPGAVTFDASYIDRTYRDRPASVEINQIYEYDPALGHVVWRGIVDPTQNSITLSTNNSWNWLVYHGLEFTATKQTHGLNLHQHLHARLGLHRRHVAAERPGGDPPTRHIPERGRHRDGPRGRHEQHRRRHAQPFVAEASVPPRRELACAVGPQSLYAGDRCSRASRAARS